MSKLHAEPALVGRDHEINQLRQHLNSALNGKGTTVFICGEAGIGKTRLVNEFLNLSRETGTEVLKGNTRRLCQKQNNIATRIGKS